MLVRSVATSLQIARGAYSESNESNYEPEKQTDGPPMIASANRNLAAPIYKWNSDDHHHDDEGTQQVAPAASPTTTKSKSIRRQADRDPEEEFDDDERDEDKSGSSQHGSFENPSFGESRRAAKDGEEIESFFDKHLGPPSNDASNSDDAEMSRPVISERIDPDDGYETAASTPLSDIFHTLIKAHRRPFVITTTTSGDDNPSSNSEIQQQPQQQQFAAMPQPATVDGGGQITPLASNTMSSPSQAGPFMRGTPFMDPIPFPIMAPTALTPLAYFNPISGPPPGLNPYEPPAATPSETSSQEDGHGGREIYIVRRPSVLQHIRAVAPPLQRLVQQSSNAHWRGVAPGAPHLSHPRPGPAEESAAASDDYHNYPVGAHSYTHQREHHHPTESSNEDEPSTVSYGLSFGGHSSDHAADEPENAPEEQSFADEQSGGPVPVPYHSGYSSSRNPVRFSSQSTRAYNNYNYPPQMGPGSAYMRGQGPMDFQHNQHHYHGARYHKDPSESAAQPVNYAQYSPMHSGSNQGDYASWVKRQQLLAHLDRQIKNNHYYRQNTASAPSTQYPQKAPFTVRRRFKTRLSKDDNDVDTYSSFHSEVDPYKSFTASSKLVNEPQSENTEQKGSHRDPNEAQKNQGGSSNSENANNNKDLRADFDHTNENSSNEQPKTSRNSITGPVSRNSNSQQQQKKQQEGSGGDLLGSKSDGSQPNHRVRREDADDRENDEVDDDGVWVDDDEDDDNRQTASDLNETTQDPEEEENQQETTKSAHVPGIIGNPHGYELSLDA